MNISTEEQITAQKTKRHLIKQYNDYTLVFMCSQHELILNEHLLETARRETCTE